MCSVALYIGIQLNFDHTVWARGANFCGFRGVIASAKKLFTLILAFCDRLPIF